MAVPADLDPRPARAGFVLYVSLPDGTGAPPDPAQLTDTAEFLRELAQELLPDADTSTALSFVPGGTGDVRRLGDRLTHLRLLDDPTG